MNTIGCKSPLEQDDHRDTQAAHDAGTHDAEYVRADQYMYDTLSDALIGLSRVARDRDNRILLRGADREAYAHAFVRGILESIDHNLLAQTMAQTMEQNL